MTDVQRSAIDGADDDVKNWITSVLGQEVAVSLQPPASLPAKPAPAGEVRAYLMALEPAPTNHSQRGAPLQYQVRYLVSVWADSPEREHRLLGRLVADALVHKDGELDLATPPDAIWQAFGVGPRPAFSLRVPVRVEQPALPIHRVTQPVTIRANPGRPLVGRVLGPRDIPLGGALIKHEPLNSTAETNSHGWFRFAAVPTSDAPQTITVHAKGESQAFSFKFDSMRGEPMIFRMTIGGG